MHLTDWAKKPYTWTLPSNEALAVFSSLNIKDSNLLRDKKALQEEARKAADQDYEDLCTAVRAAFPQYTWKLDKKQREVYACTDKKKETYLQFWVSVTAGCFQGRWAECAPVEANTPEETIRLVRGQMAV